MFGRTVWASCRQITGTQRGVIQTAHLVGWFAARRRGACLEKWWENRLPLSNRLRFNERIKSTLIVFDFSLFRQFLPDGLGKLVRRCNGNDA